MLRHTRSIFIVSLTTSSVVILDLTTKTHWFDHEPYWTRLAPLLQTISHYNYGLIFDLPAPTWLIVTLSTAVLIGLLINFRRELLEDTRTALALGLLVGGALGNGYDRIMFGFVRDWILVLERSAFNLADVAIAIGLVLLAWHRRQSELLTRLSDRLR